MSDSRSVGRARLFYRIDSLGGLLRLPLQGLLWLLMGLYLAGCMVSWGLILWVLGEKHIGILKVLILLASVFVWSLIISLTYSFWF